MDACYSMHKGIISKNVAVIPCGVTNKTNPHVTCCVRGDYCMSDSICHWNNTGSDGYYRADCTDPTLQDPACATRCGARHLSDIKYNYTTGFWSCCNYDSDGKANCDEPSSEIFPGPAPDRLVEIQYLPDEGTPEYAVAQPQNSSVSNESSPESSSSPSVSVGAAVGGGVGAGLGLFLILLAVFFLVQRRRGREAGKRHNLYNTITKEGEPQPLSSFRGGELPATEPRGTRNHPEELEGDFVRYRI
ncbi:hypothetical protein BDW66DRAFT_132992 [Aspergillus desertorum]